MRAAIAIALAVPLLLLMIARPLAGISEALPAGTLPLLSELALGIGAGIYEELVFRLLLVTLLIVVGVDVVRRDSRCAGICHGHPSSGVDCAGVNSGACGRYPLMRFRRSFSARASQLRQVASQSTLRASLPAFAIQ